MNGVWLYVRKRKYHITQTFSRECRKHVSNAAEAWQRVREMGSGGWVLTEASVTLGEQKLLRVLLIAGPW